MAWVGERIENMYNYSSGEMEDVGHFVLSCEYVAEERERMEWLMGTERKNGRMWKMMKD